MNPQKNLDALLIGTGEFSFSEGATSVADARLKGFLDFGNIKALTPSMEKTELVHKGSYRGKLIKDRTVTTENSMIYTLQCEEWEKEKLRMLFQGEAGSGHTQSAKVSAVVDAWEFTVETPSVIGRWYNITTSTAQLMRLTAVVLLTSGTGTSVVAEADDETFTDVAHGLVNGDTIILKGTAPTGLAIDTVYYVVNKTNDTFQLAATSGGTALTFSTDGSGLTWYPALIEGEDFEVDLLLGRVQFYAEHTTTITPTVSAPAIASTDENFLNSIVPLTDTRIEGYGRLVLYDQHDKEVVMDHRDFKCEITAESAGAVDGANWSELQLKVTISADVPGEVYTRE